MTADVFHQASIETNFPPLDTFDDATQVEKMEEIGTHQSSLEILLNQIVRKIEI